MMLNYNADDRHDIQPSTESLLLSVSPYSQLALWKRKRSRSLSDHSRSQPNVSRFPPTSFPSMDTGSSSIYLRRTTSFSSIGKPRFDGASQSDTGFNASTLMTQSAISQSITGNNKMKRNSANNNKPENYVINTARSAGRDRKHKLLLLPKVKVSVKKQPIPDPARLALKIPSIKVDTTLPVTPLDCTSPVSLSSLFDSYFSPTLSNSDLTDATTRTSFSTDASPSNSCKFQSDQHHRSVLAPSEKNETAITLICGPSTQPGSTGVSGSTINTSSADFHALTSTFSNSSASSSSSSSSSSSAFLPHVTWIGASVSQQLAVTKSNNTGNNSNSSGTTVIFPEQKVPGSAPPNSYPIHPPESDSSAADLSHLFSPPKTTQNSSEFKLNNNKINFSSPNFLSTTTNTTPINNKANHAREEVPLSRSNTLPPISLSPHSPYSTSALSFYSSSLLHTPTDFCPYCDSYHTTQYCPTNSVFTAFESTQLYNRHLSLDLERSLFRQNPSSVHSTSPHASNRWYSLPSPVEVLNKPLPPLPPTKNPHELPDTVTSKSVKVKVKVNHHQRPSSSVNDETNTSLSQPSPLLNKMSLLKPHRQVSTATSTQNLLSSSTSVGPSTAASNSSLNRTQKRPHFFRRLFGGGGSSSTTPTISPRSKTSTVTLSNTTADTTSDSISSAVVGTSKEKDTSVLKTTPGLLALPIIGTTQTLESASVESSQTPATDKDKKSANPRSQRSSLSTTSSDHLVSNDSSSLSTSSENPASVAATSSSASTSARASASASASASGLAESAPVIHQRHRSQSSSAGSSDTTDTNTTLKVVTNNLSPRTPKSSTSSVISQSLDVTPIRPPFITGLDNSQPRLMLDIEPSSPFFSSEKNMLNFDSPATKPAEESADMQPQVESSSKESLVVPTSSKDEGSLSKNSQGEKTSDASLPSTPLLPSSPSINSQVDDYFTPASNASVASLNSPESQVTKSSTDAETLSQNTSFQMSPSSTSNIDPALLAAITNTEAQNMALDFYHGTANSVPMDGYASWMGDEGNLQKDTRDAFMHLFTWKGKSILAALRDLCEKLYMKGESQQLHRIMESFSNGWHSMNPKHGFVDANVVYTIAYALLLLNTDLYAADHTANKKISKSKFVSNTMETIKGHIATLSAETKNTIQSKVSQPVETRTAHHRMSSFSYTMGLNKDDSLILVNECPIPMLSREWQFQIESVLKVFYASVSKDALELHCSDPHAAASRQMSLSHSSGLSSMSSSTMASHGMASTSSFSSTSFNGSVNNSGNNLMPSLSLTPSIRQTSSSSSIFGRLALNRLRNNRSSYDSYNQSRIDVGSERNTDSYRRDSFNSLFSMESTYSSAFGFNRHAVGFAGLLASSMIKEDETAAEESFGDFSKIEEELAKEVELELLGAPWAKEGLLKYRPYIDPNSGKKYKRKDWIQVFVVVQRGQLKMFKFDRDSSSSTSATAAAGGVVGAGNWMESANMVDGFHLCHTMAQELPPTKKARGYSALWSLTLPQHGVLVFEAGTKEIAKEYVYTCNYWAGRLSKEPFDEPVSSMEYGWGAPLEGIEEDETAGTDASAVSSKEPPRLSHKSSTSALGRVLPGDRLTIKEWRPSGQSLIVSDLNEEKQATNLREYVTTAEQNLSHHNALRARMVQAFTPNSPNFSRAHANWERKSQYLLQQFIRYKIYVDCLEKALEDKASKNLGSNGFSDDDVTINSPPVS